MVAGSTMLSLIQTHLTPELEQLDQDSDSGVDPGGGAGVVPPPHPIFTIYFLRKWVPQGMWPPPLPYECRLPQFNPD